MTRRWRRIAPFSLLATGLALLALSVNGIASMDRPLREASARVHEASGPRLAGGLADCITRGLDGRSIPDHHV